MGYIHVIFFSAQIWTIQSSATFFNKQRNKEIGFRSQHDELKRNKNLFFFFTFCVKAGLHATEIIYAAIYLFFFFK